MTSCMGATIDYLKIIEVIDSSLKEYREDDFVYLLSAGNGNVLFQELEDKLILWSNENKKRTKLEVYEAIITASPVDVVVPFVETAEEYKALISLKAEPYDFQAEGCEEYSKEYGSFILRKESSHAV